ncbi:hypothetical protein SEPCBS57363_003872 [Sporothrix epigloea]|uniref:alpha-1,2-Mannosidase n=1 Tax=Sporothrix epigloea TaxID=1892477 RepID=A0ABP0DQ95_9PEZI
MAFLRLRRYRVYVLAALLLLFLTFRLAHNSELGSQQKLVVDGYTTPPGESGTHAHSNDDGAHPDAGLTEVDGSRNDAFVNDRKLVAQADVPSGQPVQLPESQTSLAIKSNHGILNGLPSPPPIAPQRSAAAEQVLAIQGDGNEDFNSINKAVPSASEQEMAITQQPLPSTNAIHWVKMAEFFPIPEESLIPLPTGKPESLPSIQHKFETESREAREIRESRLASVRNEMKHAWTGYRTYAWTHDELAPNSKGFSDPFCGWAASLVDALDTLWIMKMYDEFDEAYEAVKHIDFTTTPYRDEIPVFETIIRYLGGLVAAYDVSGGIDGKYPMLLTKAVQLAEILMGVFDTPNRMPLLYYNWKPTYSPQPKTASTSVSVAELGSMSMEFTRLAQLTGHNRYYDAIARITNAFEEWQNRVNGTAIPGIFPEHIDASGCNVTAAILAVDENAGNGDGETDPLSFDRAEDEIQIAKALRSNFVNFGKEPSTLHTDRDPSSKNLLEDSTHTNGVGKRALSSSAVEGAAAAVKASEFVCIPQNLTAVGYGMQMYSMGGSQDSTYEYFPKANFGADICQQYILLGGLVPRYRAMYEKVADAVKGHLLYRPMIKEDRDILFSAKAASLDSNSKNLVYNYEVTHLTCFLGGMFAMGGRIFDRPEDIEIGAKLADGCVWSYEVMPTGIMPEAAIVAPCFNATSCSWNETAWFEQLDPESGWRDKELVEHEQRMQAWIKIKNDIEQLQQALDEDEERERLENEPLTPARPPASAVAETREAVSASISKRDNLAGDETAGLSADAESNDATTNILQNAPNPGGTGSDIQSAGDAESPVPQAPAASGVDAAAARGSLSEKLVLPPMPNRPMSHRDFVNSRIERDSLQPGFIYINDRRYILRPEAIESVWYMYRITGDPSWQEKGWRMFEAVIRASRTDCGHSGIIDVTVDPSLSNNQLDNMESFWFAETLKYFYLLFTTPDVISLDDYVLNTEAHPFKRPT